MLRRLFTALAFFAITSASHAQSVRWEPGSGTLALNQLSELSLVFDQCDPTGNVTLPNVTGLMFGAPTRSENTSFNVVNFKATSVRTVTLTYRVRPTERTTLVIPPFNVETDKGRQRVASATFEVGDATVGKTGLSPNDVAQARFTVPPSAVWAGEVFPLTYTLNASKRYLHNLNKDFEWDAAPLITEPWPNPEQFDAVLNNDPRVSIIYKTRAVVKTPGDYALHPATQLVNITTGSSSFGLFARPNIEQFLVTSPRVDLSVRPLPSPAPAGFAGAVGKFTLDSTVVPATAAVGEPITWTLTLQGTGNWPDIAGLPARSVSKDFRIVQPQAKRTNKENSLFDASITEDIVLIPTKPGTYTLGPVTFTVFNPTTGSYDTLTTKSVTIQVTAAERGGERERTDPVSSSPSDPSSRSGERERTDPVPAAVGDLPRDPLPPAGHSTAPFSLPGLLIGLLSSVLCPLLGWFALALRRARLTDPARPLREAHSRLAATIRALADTGKPEVRNAEPQVSILLQAWQRDTAILWRLPQAVPTATSFPDDTWSTLWSEADHTLYGDAPLPDDWTTRATHALTTRRAPSFSVFQLWIPRNLIPLVLLLSSIALSPSSFAVEGSGKRERADPMSAYAKGDFAAAGTTWTSDLKTAPTDWTAHHNLALALIQQNRPGEAAGHALAAFVQRPQNPSVRWHLVYAFRAAGVSPAALKPWISDAPAGSLARLASPTRWQTILIASAWIAALAILLGVHGAYQKHPRKWLVRSLVAGSILFGAAAAVSLRTYGSLADARAVIVVAPTTLRSIPSDLDTPQKSTPLALGVIATTDKVFLGWRRLSFPDGQTGWVRAETLVPLWK